MRYDERMGIRQIELDDEPSQLRMWLKVIFLVVVVGVGLFFLSSNTSNSKKTAHNATPSQTPTQTPFPSPKYSLDDLKGETLKVASNTAQKAQKKAGEVLGEVANQVAAQIGQEVKDKASDSAQVVIDYAYKNTVFQAMQKMIESLPSHQQSEFEKMICRD